MWLFFDPPMKTYRGDPVNGKATSVIALVHTSTVKTLEALKKSAAGIGGNLPGWMIDAGNGACSLNLLRGTR